jgi:hypothetical protein
VILCGKTKFAKISLHLRGTNNKVHEIPESKMWETTPERYRRCTDVQLATLLNCSLIIDYKLISGNSGQIVLGVTCAATAEIVLGVTCAPTAETVLGVTCAPTAEIVLGVTCAPTAETVLGVTCAPTAETVLGVTCAPTADTILGLLYAHEQLKHISKMLRTHAYKYFACGV